MTPRRAVREARTASQAYRDAMRRLTIATVMKSPDVLELEANKHMARNLYFARMRDLNP